MIATGIIITACLYLIPNVLFAKGKPSPSVSPPFTITQEIHPSTRTYLNHHSLVAKAVDVLLVMNKIFHVYSSIITLGKDSCFVSLL